MNFRKIIIDKMTIENYQHFYPMKEPKFGIHEVDIIKEEYYKSVCDFIDNGIRKIYTELSIEYGKEGADIIYNYFVIPNFKKKWHDNLFRYDCIRRQYSVNFIINGEFKNIGECVINHDNVYDRLLKECDYTKIYSRGKEVYDLNYYDIID